MMIKKLLSAKIRFKQLLSALLFRVLPIDPTKIVIVNYVGAGYGDNAKYVVDKILTERKGLKIVWALSDTADAEGIPKGVSVVKYESFRFFYELYTAGIWLDNCRKHRYIRKRNGQYYIQTWHGDVAFKKIEADVIDSLPTGYIKNAKNDAKMTDLMTSGSGFFTKLCRKSFWYSGEILECGCARNDVFFDKKYCDVLYEKIRKHYNFEQTDKVLLYAPTFRKDQTLKYYDIDFPSTLETLRQKFGGNWKILVRLHPNIAAKSREMTIWNDCVVNATDYPDAQELLIASDIVITDYSSIVFDFSLLGRPVFLFAPDYDLYDKDRGFYLDYFKLPFPVAENTEDLQKNIMKYSEKKYKAKLDDFLQNSIETKETGHAAEKIAKRILEEIDRAKDDKNNKAKEDKKAKVDAKKTALLKNTIMLYVLTFSSYFFNFITVPYQTRVLGPDIYGDIGFALALVSYFKVLFDFGFILSATETVSKHRENKVELGKTLSAVNAVKAFFVFAAMLLMAILLMSVGRLQSDPLLYILFFVYVAIDAFLPDFLYRGLENMKVITYRSVLIRLFFTLLLFVFLKEPSQYYVIPILNILGSVFAVISVYLHIHFKLKIRHRKVDKKYIFKTFKKSGLFFLSRIASTLYSSTNTVALGFIYPTGPTVGLYTSANKVVTIAQSAMTPVSDSVYPYMVKNKDFKLIKKILLIFEPIIIFGCIIVGLLAEPICILLFGNEFAGAAPILRIMLVVVAVTLPNYMLGFPTMTPLGISKYANYSVIIAAGWQVVSLLILFAVGAFSLYPICIATAITECVVLATRVLFIRNRDRLIARGKKS